ncbi:unnamed protein product, partial [Mesorhabditis belari]|uniref:Uncharacterized protein n=1 Tax=Mesorhabditis belari TaxID=2138241 RepID=A0AAF3FIW2_9BILA
MRFLICILPIIYTLADEAASGQFTTAPQCRCKDIDDCSADFFTKQAACKREDQCLNILKKVGDPNKIRQCLDIEHSTVHKVEGCVKKKINGELGCTNDAIPKNLTIPLIPVIESPLEDDSEGAQAQEPSTPNQVPPELGKYVMCVDQCAMGDDAEFTGIGRRKKRSAINCAFKLKCALSPPDDRIQRAFLECENQLGIQPQKKIKESCECLKGAGVKIECPID